MNCADPECGDPVTSHYLDETGQPQECLRGMFGGAVPPCWCNRFVSPREPLLAQLDAVIRTRIRLCSCATAEQSA